MKKIFILILILMSTISYSEQNLKKDLNQVIKKIKKGELGFEISLVNESNDFLKMEFIVNGKVLHYAFYKNDQIYEKELDIFLKDDFFNHLSEEIVYEKYKLIELDPIISSPVYGRWYALIGENQIIKGSGDSFASAQENIDEFYNRL
ncbi:MAG: hypothetical protein ACRCYT_08620, partial [Cetobacterium sp.]